MWLCFNLELRFNPKGVCPEFGHVRLEVMCLSIEGLGLKKPQSKKKRESCKLMCRIKHNDTYRRKKQISMRHKGNFLKEVSLPSLLGHPPASTLSRILE